MSGDAPAGAHVRRDQLRALEQAAQKRWAAEKVFEQDAPEDEAGRAQRKFLVTFPYPYMNGRLHVGHTFTVSKAEFAAQYHRMKGDKVLFPFSFHCTGMPISAAADKLANEIKDFGNPPVFPSAAEEETTQAASEAAAASAEKELGVFKAKKTKVAQKGGAGIVRQWTIMQSMGIPDEEIPKFADAAYWLQYFPPHTKTDLQKLGCAVDWRRSFITTDANPYYDAFIRWQFTKLHKQGRIKNGVRPTIFSPKDGGPCMDHDRATGEGKGPQEYTLIKLRVLPPFPDALAALNGRDVFLAPATLRPETMYGQTNCFVLPTGTYGAYEMADGSVFMMGARAARNMAFQDLMTVKNETPVPLLEVQGQALIGLPLKAPLTTYERVYTLPLLTISMSKGTGVVTSVPSDAPDDYIALQDLKNDAKLRERFHVKEEWVAPFEVIPIIEVPGYGTTAAVKACEDFKVKSQKDKAKLVEAKGVVYTKGFYEGRLIVGPHKGQLVKDAKDLVRQDMVKAGDALTYREPETVIMSRSGEECVVALTAQWYLTYGEEEWREQTRAHLNNGVDTYGEETRRRMNAVLDWLHEWACSRSYGLGTLLPCDEQYLIESLSDSTIYMAFYTIAHMLQGGVVDGSQVGPAGIKPEQLTYDVFEHIFMDAPYPEGCGIDKAVLAKLKSEFSYWYPVNLRVSGKDLIQNHLTFWLYNHVALFPPKYWPTGMRANGHVMLNSAKMSKSTGNFLTLSDAVDKYGADALRMALAFAGDDLVDGNIEEKTADECILRLTRELEWMSRVIGVEDEKQTQRTGDKLFLDRAVLNEINHAIIETDKHYDRGNFREGFNCGYFEMQKLRDTYRFACAGVGMHRDVLHRFVSVQTLLLVPVAPHFCEHIWTTVLGHTESVIHARWPEAEPVDQIQIRAFKYLEDTVRAGRAKLTPKAAKGGKKGAAPPTPKEQPNKMTVYVTRDYLPWQQACLTLLQASYDAGSNAFVGDKELMASVMQHELLGKAMMKKAMQFISFVKAQVAKGAGAAAMDLQMPFDEVAVLTENLDYLKRTWKLAEVDIQVVSPDDMPVQPAKPAFRV